MKTRWGSSAPIPCSSPRARWRAAAKPWSSRSARGAPPTSPAGPCGAPESRPIWCPTRRVIRRAAVTYSARRWWRRSSAAPHSRKRCASARAWGRATWRTAAPRDCATTYWAASRRYDAAGRRTGPIRRSLVRAVRRCLRCGGQGRRATAVRRARHRVRITLRACQNIVEHAGTGGWVAVQAYHWRRKLARRVVVIAVADAGVGFRHSLEPTQSKRFGARWSDAAALEAALVQGISRFRDPGRGQGLAGIRRYLTRWDGKIAIRSGTARIAIVPKWDDDVPRP